MRKIIISTIITLIPLVLFSQDNKNAPATDGSSPATSVSIYKGRLGNNRMEIMEKCGYTKYIGKNVIVYINPSFKNASDKNNATMLVSYYFNTDDKVVAIRYTHYTNDAKAGQWGVMYKKILNHYQTSIFKERQPKIETIKREGITVTPETTDKLIYDRELILTTAWEHGNGTVNLLSYLRGKDLERPEISMWIFHERNYEWVKRFQQQLVDGKAK